MVLSVVVLTLMLACTAWCLLTRDRIAAVALVVCAAAWFPANNRHLEGRTVWVISDLHAVTVADLIGLACWLIGTVVLFVAELPDHYDRVDHNRSVGALVACLVALAAGAVAAVATG